YPATLDTAMTCRPQSLAKRFDKSPRTTPRICRDIPAQKFLLNRVLKVDKAVLRLYNGATRHSSN
ncbi:MAG: hypothetical protein AB8G77_14380, partial [Rhodothermales bacterium]